jgi:mRNA interferase RelE/StbE
MMYRIVYSKQALKALKKMPGAMAERTRRKMEEIAKNPFAIRSDVSPLRGRPGFRLRVGNYRAVFTVQDEILQVFVIKIGPRGDVYK